MVQYHTLETISSILASNKPAKKAIPKKVKLFVKRYFLLLVEGHIFETLKTKQNGQFFSEPGLKEFLQTELEELYSINICP